MIKNKIISILPQAIIVTMAVLLYVVTDFFCMNNCPFFVFGRIEPLYTGLLFFIPTILCFLFFPWKVFVSWTKHVAWWFAFFTMWAITNLGGGSFLNPSRNKIAILCMVILFIITIIYVIIMNKRLKENQ